MLILSLPILISILFSSFLFNGRYVYFHSVWSFSCGGAFRNPSVNVKLAPHCAEVCRSFGNACKLSLSCGKNHKHGSNTFSCSSSSIGFLYHSYVKSRRIKFHT